MRVRMSSFGLGRIDLLLAVLCLCSSCAGAAADYPPAPAGWRTAPEREKLERVTRTIAREPWASKRFVLIGELQQMVGGIESTEPGGATENEEIPLFIVRTVHAVFTENPPRAGLSERLGDAIGDMPRRIPKELVAAGLTKPEDWAEGLWDQTQHGGATSSVAMTMMESAGVFEPRMIGLGGSFSHLRGVLSQKKLLELAHGRPILDPILTKMFARDRYTAARELINRTSNLLKEPEGTIKRTHELTRMLAFAEIAVSEERAQWGWANRETMSLDKKPPYSPKMQQIMLALARQPEWPVHLYLWDLMGFYDSWRDPEVINTIVAHRHSISLRFLARSGMIDPALVPAPPALEDLEPRARVIPTSRATTRSSGVDD